MALPGILFCFIFVIGNFMLLNLFLAILLKSISNIGEEEEAAHGGAAKEGEEGKKDDENGHENGAVMNGDGPVDHNQIEVRMLKKDDKKSGMNEGASQSRSEMPEDQAENKEANVLNSSNSNIEEEFEQIKE